MTHKKPDDYAQRRRAALDEEFNERVEEAYWRFITLKTRPRPMADRDAFKAAVRELLVAP